MRISDWSSDVCSSDLDRAGLAGLEDRQVGERDPHPVRQLGKRQPAIVQQVVEPDDDRHQTVPSRSRRIAAPCANTRANTNSASTPTSPDLEKSDLKWIEQEDLPNHWPEMPSDTPHKRTATRRH